MKVYVAGPSAELDKLAHAMEVVRRAGCEVVHDWVAEIRARGEANPSESADQYARQDLAGIDKSEALFYIHASVGGPVSPGALAELVYAYARKKPIYAFADPGDRGKSIFLSLATSSHYGYELETVAKQLAEDGVRGVPAFTKFDSEKPRTDLLDPAFLLDVADGLGHGARKYSVDNWKQGDLARYTGAAMRHLLAIMAGEFIDPDSGIPHAALLGCNTQFIHWLQKNKE